MPDEPYCQRGGGRAGVVFMSWPFAKFSVFHDHLEVIGNRFPKDDALVLRRKRTLFGGIGIEVIHPRNAASGLMFHPMNLGELESVLMARGYQVSQTSDEPSAVLGATERLRATAITQFHIPLILICLGIVMSGVFVIVAALQPPRNMTVVAFWLAAIVIDLALTIFLWSRRG